MKKFYIFVLIASLAFFACKKESENIKEESLSKKFAKYQSWVYADKNLKKGIALLNKAEPVELISLEKARGKEPEIAKIRMTDDTVGYIKTESLAEKPIVFTTHTKAFVRNNTGSAVHATIPAGSLGFIIEEKADWIKVFIGKVGDKWINGQWVKAGFSEDENLIVDAKTYEQAVNAIDSDQSNEKDKSDAVEKLKELVNAKNLFSELAKKKLSNLDIRAVTPVKDDKETPAVTENKQQ